MKAIPTIYNGRRFRSRLEARWAAMFDLLGWPYEYEPVDFDGWIPDFLLLGAKRLFVEVKPVEIFPEDIAVEIDRSGCKDECLIVGTVMLRSEEIVLPSMGWIGELSWDGPDHDRFWQSAVAGCWAGSELSKDSPLAPLGNPRRVLGICAENGYWRDRITGFYDGGCLGGHYGNEAERIYRLWQEAGNMVQWMRAA